MNSFFLNPKGGSQLTFEDLRGLRAEGYVRDSTLDQRDGYGPDIQKHNEERFALSYGLVLGDRWYTDFVSGRTVHKRQEFNKLMEDAALDRFDVLLVDHTSRFGRNQAECIHYKQELGKLGKIIVFVSQGIISGTDRDFLTERINETLDEQYSRSLSRYVSSGMTEKAAHGYANGLPPLGYKSEILPGRKGERKIPDPDATLPILMELLRKYAEAKYSFREVADHVNALGYRTQNGNLFTGHTVKDVLSNRFYEGKVVFHAGQVDEQVFEGVHEVPAELKELWLRCQEVKRERRNTTAGRPAGPKRAFPFSRLLICEPCGNPYHGEAVTKYGNIDLRMTHERRGPGRLCTARPRSASTDFLVSQFAEVAIGHLSLDNRWKDRIIKSLGQETASTKGEEQSAAIQRALEKLRKQHLWGDISDQDYRREHSDLDRQLRSVQPRPATIHLPNLERGARILNDLPALWLHPGVSHEQRQSLIKEVFSKITINGKDFVSIEPKPVYAPLFATMLLDKKLGYCGREPPPSPPETRKVILRTGKLVRGIFFVEDYTTSFPGGGYLEQGLKGGLGFQGYNGLLLHGVHVDRVQHCMQQLMTFAEISLLPQGRQVFQQFPRFPGHVDVGYHQAGCPLF